MSTSIAEFWKLLEKSRLVGAEHCHALAQQFGQLKGVGQQGNAQTLAEWLVTQQAISRYQAKVLLAGKPGPFFYNGYVLYDKVADGPLKGCYRALHPASRHTVALHFFDPEARSEEWKAAAETVLTAAAWQGHPYLQDLYQLQDFGKKRFTVIGDQPGVSLDKVLAKQQRLPVHEACRIVREMLLGLNVMHQAGAVHGAIRPVNIILAPGTNQAVLLQPPIARPFWPIPGTVDLSPYTNEQLMVQVDYMAPELAHAGIPASPVSDIYATGCLLYQLLSGRPPFAGGEVAGKFMRHASEPVQPLEPLGVPPQLAQVVMYTMAKDPSIRYQSAAQLIEALTYFVDPRALQAVPQSAPTLSPFLGWLREQPSIPTALDQELYGTAPAEQFAAPGIAAAEFGGPARGAKTLELAASGGGSESLVALLAERKQRSQQRMVFGGIGALAVLMIGFIVYKATTRVTPPDENPVQVAVNTPAKNSGKGKTPPAQTPTSVVSPDKAPPESSPMEPPKTPMGETKNGGDEVKTSMIDDDGKALWASPTSGPPLNFSELPPSPQIFMSVRPWDLLNKNRFNLKFFQAAGPLAEMGRAKVEADVGLNFNEINLLQIAWVSAPDGLTPVYYVRAKDRASADQWKQKLGSPADMAIGDKTVGKGAKLMYYWPAADNGMRMIAAYPAQMQELLTAPARTHPKVEKLLKFSDEQRLFNLIVSTNYLFADGASAMPGQLPLVKKLEQILSYDTVALSLSVHLDDQNFFTELKMQPSASHTPTQAALLFKEQMRGWEAGATAFVGEALQKNNQAYGFNVLMGLPRRIGKFTSMTRADEDQGVVVVRSYLNAAAAEHLMQGAELALAYSGTGAGAPQLALGSPAPAGTGGTPAPAQPTGNTPADKLKKVVSLTFDRDTLEKSMVMLGEELGTTIDILGGDLQLEGITKNQSFGLDEKNKTGSEILQVIMKKANPDGKLVYIIKPKTPGGEDMILVTTRAAVAKRGDKLPAELVIEAKPPGKK